jgi:enamine deaminase RidA (YjgF/YER057c/UK114 family)
VIAIANGVFPVLMAGPALAVLAAADMTLANIVRLNVYTTDFDELVQHWARLTGRFANSGDSFVTSLLGVTRLFTPELLVMLEATAVA